PDAGAPDEASAPISAVVLDQGGLDEVAIGLAVGALVATSEEDDVAPPIPLVAPPRSRRARLRRERDCEIWVSVLGRVPEVAGWATPVRGRRKLTEVFVYLAVYGTERAIPGGELRTHCWPPQVVTAVPGERPQLREVSPESFHQAMSRLRKQLGEGAAGWHLPPAVDGAYGIGPGVGCDWTLFRALAATGSDAAARHETGRAIEAWREALELVRGQPFADVAPRSYVWADSEQLVTDIRLAVAKVAHDLAALTSESEPETALWATQQGLLLLPTQLSLFDQAMAAAAEMGDVDGIERAFAAKCWACEQLDPDGGVPAETTELYRHLMAKAEVARVGASR
ncbi:MAG TPA: BTAD domain-containing putative transcriptional regulator, partial [Acidimicrobiales bacterium]